MAVDSAFVTIEAWLRSRQPDLGGFFAKAVRKAIDEVLDGARTGRFRFSELDPQEKVYVGKKVEIVTRAELGLTAEPPLDMVIKGYPVDIKWSQEQGWMIPKEYVDINRYPDGPICLVIGWRKAYGMPLDAGLVRIRENILTLIPNRDGKRHISKQGKKDVHWLVRDLRTPPNYLETLPDKLLRELAVISSGQGRIRTLLEAQVGEIIPRSAIETLARQRDPMRRIRDDAGERLPGLKVFTGTFKAQVEAVRLLGYGELEKDTLIAVRIAELMKLPPDLRRKLRLPPS